jgi:ribonucleoside-diphosphate reductase alpha chain
MEVVKRNGKREPVSFDKVKYRIQNMLALPDDVERLKSSDPQLYTLKSNLAPLTHVDVDVISQKVIAAMFNGVSTTELDDITASIAQPRLLVHPEYGDLAARIAVSNYHKNNIYDVCDLIRNRSGMTDVTDEMIEKYLFTWTMKALYDNVDAEGNSAPLVAPYVLGILNNAANVEWIESQIDYSRDYNHDYVGFKLLHKTYLQRIYNANGKPTVIERPQHMFMRVAIGIHCAEAPAPDYRQAVKDALAKNASDPLYTEYQFWHTAAGDATRALTDEEKFHIARTYEGLSKGYIMHATPTLFNAGTLVPQLSSCYLTTPPSASIEGIADWNKNCMLLSKWAGGIGSHVHKFRAQGSYIRGTGGFSNGLKPWLQIVDKIAVGVDQGGGKRPGSHAIYLEPWHADIMDFLSLKKLRGSDEDRARNLFYALWLNDEFMRCLQTHQPGGTEEPWYLMCPDRSRGLAQLYDQVLEKEWVTNEMISENPGVYAFTERYREYVREGNYVKKVSPVDIWNIACEVIMETGVPYVLFKDAVNRKSNQKNIGTVESSNLCTEIVEVSTSDETAVCNLASICLPKFVRTTEDGAVFDFEKMRAWVQVCTYNLNRIIDINFYPIPEARKSNMRHRPMGIGEQGLADTFTAMRMAFDSQEAMELSFRISEVRYMEALRESARLAKRDGVYPSFNENGGCPAAHAKLQMDLWVDELGPEAMHFTMNTDAWTTVRALIAKHGLRNSLFVAPMPTGSTSTIMGNSPCFEPHSSLVYKRRNKAGEFTIVNRALINELIERGLWTEKVKNQILSDRRGSIADVVGIPRDIKNLYKISWDMSPKAVINHALCRGPFVDQSQSMSLFIPRPTTKLLTQVHFYSWRRGIKTSSYYTRRLAVVDAQKTQLVTTESTPESNEPIEDEEYIGGPVCVIGDDGCLSCQ